MVAAVTTTFAKFKILIGDGGSPTEAFTPVCGLTSKGIDWNADTVTSEVPDCANEDLPSWQEKDIKSVGASLSGSGMWSTVNHPILLNWISSAAKKNIQVEYTDAVTGSPKTIAGPAVLTKLSNQVDKGGRLQADLTIEFTSKPTITNAP